MIRVLLVVAYILNCLRFKVMPWHYFQLNSAFFNSKKGIYSKQEINELIPEQWRLEQWLDHQERQPDSYPVFFKPEWGQNSKGVQCANTLQELESIRNCSRSFNNQVAYVVQQAAPGHNEYEIFITPSVQNSSGYSIMSVTQVVNKKDGKYPINGIYNKNTKYIDITKSFSEDDLNKLWSQLRCIGSFNISRFGIRADSIKALIAGNFKIIEINLFLPMPLVLLSENKSLSEKIIFAIELTNILAKLTGELPQVKNKPFILFGKINFLRRIKRTN